MTIGFIPARGGSKGIPGKNMKDFLGKPLLFWTIDAFNDARIPCAVATDDTMMLNLAFDRGARAYRRSDESARDDSPTEEVLEEWLDSHYMKDDDKVILAQCTSPYTTAFDIKGVEKMLDDFDSVLTCARSKRFFWWDDGTPANYEVEHRPLRQDWDGTFMENGALYGFRVAALRAGGGRLSGHIGIWEQKHSFELDTPDDWIIGEQIMRAENA